VWFFALNACHPDGDETPEPSDPGTVVGQPAAGWATHTIAEARNVGDGGSCPECGAELVRNNCTSGVCPSASCHNCGYGCDLFTDGAGKCVMALRKKLPPTNYES